MAPVLVLVHNHRFEAIIPKLEQIYGERFSRLLHLVPFYSGTNSKVIPVCENSFQFQAFFAQAYPRLSQLECDHFIFCADDLILNPKLNENNIISALRLEHSSAYIKAITHLAEVPFSWPYAIPVLVNFVGNNGLAWRRELPAPQTINAALTHHKVRLAELGLHNFRNGIRPKQLLLLLYYLILRAREQRGQKSKCFRDLPYPMAYAYSDFFILPRSALERFCDYCAIFAAMNLFVEIAIPLSLLLTCEQIVCEKDTSWRGVELWGDLSRERLEQANEQSLAKLLANFPADRLYIHPVKLSRWSG